MSQIASTQDEVNTISATITSLLGPCTSSGDAVNLVKKSRSVQKKTKKLEQSIYKALKSLQYTTVQFNNRDEQLRVQLSLLNITSNNKVMCI
jgi:hypothetical protein